MSEQERWPNQLAVLLRSHGLTVDDPYIIAQSAWTTDELADAIAEANSKRPYGLVTLLSGVNDQYRSRPVETFGREFALLLKRARSLAGRRPARVIALSIPDWGATPFAKGRDQPRIAHEIDSYNRRANTLCAAIGAHWVDITTVTRRMEHESRLVAADGLHPSGDMYRLWAEVVAPIALSAIVPKRRQRESGQ